MLIVVWAIAALIQGHRLQSGLERMPPKCVVRGIALLVVICSGLMEVHCVAGDVVVVSTVLLAERGRMSATKVCRESGVALPVLACAGLLAECVNEDTFRYICE